jgi:glyoxylase I family protein
MTHSMIEHVNLTVSNPEQTAALMSGIFGWHVRWSGEARDGGRSIHVGSETSYVAVYAGPDEGGPSAAFAKGQPLNHVGILVDDLDAVEARVIAHGLSPFNHDTYEPGRRFYFFDADGIEYEVISYSSESVLTG